MTICGRFGISTAEDLNNIIRRGNMEEVIYATEELHKKRGEKIVEDICNDGRRVILIAGPSSSGKTTFAKKISEALKEHGHAPLYMGTDDYFVDRAYTPIGKDGKPDYESLEAVDVKLFNDNLGDLLKGKEVAMPEFNFHKGEKEFGKRIERLKENGTIVIEGIHGLNDELTKSISHDDKYKIYICPKSRINLGELGTATDVEMRLLRRIVRDNNKRGYSAKDTLDNWANVRRGEKLYIEPYVDTADVYFNSAFVYEMPLLKKYAMPLLKNVEKDEDEEEFWEAQRLMNTLSFFETYTHEEFIPKDSLIREFIGDGD